MSHPVMDLLVRLVLAAVAAVVVGLVDQVALGVDLPWWACALIGLTLVFGGVLIIRVADDL